MTLKKAMVVSDLCGFGRCSLTVALPILSAAGIQTSIIPTAVLSTHTAFPEPYVRSLTHDIPMIAEHWKSLGLEFDAVYTGYLSSEEQSAHVKKILDDFRNPRTVVMVDPVMGDNGRMYKNLTSGFPEAMRALCSKADIIVPNMTEAALLLEKKYSPGPYKLSELEETASELTQFGCRYVVLTGAYTDCSNIGVAVFDKENKNLSCVTAKKFEGHYHGTGDIFASVLLAYFLNGHSIHDASERAVFFTAASLNHTYSLNEDTKYGVNFEAALVDLIRNI